MGRVLGLAYGGWLFIIFHYGHGLSRSFLSFKLACYLWVGEVSDLESLTRAEGLPASLSQVGRKK